MSSSRFVVFTSPSTAASSSIESGCTTSSGNSIVSIVITPSCGRSATRFSFERITTRAIATLSASSHRVEQELVGLRGALVRREVVRVVVVDRVDLLEVHEVLDVDRARLLRLERLELLGRDRHVVVRADLVALDDLLVRDLVTRGRVHPLLADALARLGVDLVEPDGLARDGAVELDGMLTSPKLIAPLQIARGMHQRYPPGGFLTFLAHAFLRRYVGPEALEGGRAQRPARRPLAELHVGHEPRLHEHACPSAAAGRRTGSCPGASGSSSRLSSASVCSVKPVPTLPA